MSRKNTQKQVVVEQTTSVPQEISKAENVQEYASEVLAAFEKEVESCKTRQTGMGLPMSEVIEALDLIFDTVQTDRAPVKLMAHKVAAILKFKYSKMSETATHEITVRINAKTTMTMPECDLRALRLSQLKHMSESKTDNLYRRIYNIGSRQEYGRFDATNSMIVRLKKVDEVDDQ